MIIKFNKLYFLVLFGSIFTGNIVFAANFDLTAARDAGNVCEDASGYVKIIKSSAVDRADVDMINDGRKKEYEKTAKEAGPGAKLKDVEGQAQLIITNKHESWKCK